MKICETIFFNRYSTIETEDWRGALQNDSYVLRVKLLKYICEGVPFLVKLQATYGPANCTKNKLLLRSILFKISKVSFL